MSLDHELCMLRPPDEMVVDYESVVTCGRALPCSGPSAIKERSRMATDLQLCRQVVSEEIANQSPTSRSNILAQGNLRRIMKDGKVYKNALDAGLNVR